MSDDEGAQRPRVAAFVPDLMDQSRLRALGTLVRVRQPADVDALKAELDLSGAVIDLTHECSEAIAQAFRHRWPELAIIGFGPHGDDEIMDGTENACSEVLARSVFFSRVQRGTLFG